MNNFSLPKTAGEILPAILNEIEPAPEPIFNISEISIHRRYTVNKSERQIISSSSRTYDFIKYYYLNDMETREVFSVIFLNKAAEVVSIYKLAMGGLSSCIVDLKMFVAAASLSLASSAIVVHNHPSGNLKPSASDKAITSKLKTLGFLIECPLLDHLIITEEGYFSFADEGIL